MNINHQKSIINNQSSSPFLLSLFTLKSGKSTMSKNSRILRRTDTNQKRQPTSLWHLPADISVAAWTGIKMLRRFWEPQLAVDKICITRTYVRSAYAHSPSTQITAQR